MDFWCLGEVTSRWGNYVVRGRTLSPGQVTTQDMGQGVGRGSAGGYKHTSPVPESKPCIKIFFGSKQCMKDRQDRHEGQNGIQ